jgi:hypothetical protein
LLTATGNENAKTVYYMPKNESINNALWDSYAGQDLYRGCFADPSVTRRTFPTKDSIRYIDFDDGTEVITACRKWAEEMGAYYYALQDGNVCYLGQFSDFLLRWGGITADSECNKFCAGDSTGPMCGGVLRSSVYELVCSSHLLYLTTGWYRQG